MYVPSPDVQFDLCDSLQKLGLPHYYSFVNLKDQSASPKLKHILLNHPNIGPQVRALHSLSSAHDVSLLTVLSLTTRLEQFRSGRTFDHDSFCDINLAFPTIPWAAFEVMAKSSGSSLREFSEEVCQSRAFHPSPAVFEHFTELTHLHWGCETKFDCNSEILTPHDGLKKLTDLYIWYLDPSFLTVLASMQYDNS
jgi:hypothetical protein